MSYHGITVGTETNIGFEEEPFCIPILTILKRPLVIVISVVLLVETGVSVNLLGLFTKI